MKLKEINLKDTRTIKFLGTIVFIIVLYVNSVYSKTYFSWFYLFLLAPPIYGYLKRNGKLDFIIKKAWFIKTESFFDKHPYLYKVLLLSILLLFILLKV